MPPAYYGRYSSTARQKHRQRYFFAATRLPTARKAAGGRCAGAQTPGAGLFFFWFSDSVCLDQMLQTPHLPARDDAGRHCAVNILPRADLLADGMPSFAVLLRCLPHYAVSLRQRGDLLPRYLHLLGSCPGRNAASCCLSPLSAGWRGRLVGCFARAGYRDSCGVPCPHAVCLLPAHAVLRWCCLFYRM